MSPASMPTTLLHFLHELAARWQAAAAMPADTPPCTLSLSCGDPQRNKNYRAAVFGRKKTDPVEALALARYALGERPAPAQPLVPQLRSLRQVACRLQAVVRQRTRLINQFHHLLGLAFPELALLTKDVAAGWVLELVHRYPTAALLAAATEQDVANIPYLPQRHVTALLAAARSSVASLQEATFAELLRDQVRQLRDVRARQKRLEKLLVDAYRALPTPNHLDTIPGIGPVTAAVLTAFILDIHRFPTPNHLVAYFGVLPVEAASGIDRAGQPRGPRRWTMSKRGNDLVRRYLWMSALSGVRYNPAVRALFARVARKHPDHKVIGLGHAMRKLLHLAFAVWTTGRPFDPNYYPWHAPVHVDLADLPLSADKAVVDNNQAAGHTRSAEPARKVVTAARTDSVPQDDDVGEHTFIDFAHLKRQLPMVRVLDQLGMAPRSARGAQRRYTCPIHRGDARSRTLSVNLDQGVFHCFDKTCARKGDIIDLWASVRGLSLREAALDLVRTFGLEPAAQQGTEKRQG
jgi:transposase